MPLTPGLVPNIRQDAPASDAMPPEDEIMIEMVEDADQPDIDEKGNTIKIEHSDGSITISLDGRPIEENVKEKDLADWFRNLVEDIDDMELSRVANDLIRGI